MFKVKSFRLMVLRMGDREHGYVVGEKSEGDDSWLRIPNKIM